MRILRKLAKAFSVIAVLLVAVVAGLFLSSCRGLGVSGEADRGGPGPDTQPSAAKGASQPATRPTATTKSRVDVPETQRGQPVPRNLLE